MEVVYIDDRHVMVGDYINGRRVCQRTWTWTDAGRGMARVKLVLEFEIE